MGQREYAAQSEGSGLLSHAVGLPALRGSAGKGLSRLSLKEILAPLQVCGSVACVSLLCGSSPLSQVDMTDLAGKDAAHAERQTEYVLHTLGENRLNVNKRIVISN